MLRPQLEHDAQARGWAPAATATIAAFWTEADAGGKPRRGTIGVGQGAPDPGGYRRLAALRDNRMGFLLATLPGPWPARAE